MGSLEQELTVEAAAVGGVAVLERSGQDGSPRHWLRAYWVTCWRT